MTEFAKANPWAMHRGRRRPIINEFRAELWTDIEETAAIIRADLIPDGEIWLTPRTFTRDYFVNAPLPPMDVRAYEAAHPYEGRKA